MATAGKKMREIDRPAPVSSVSMERWPWPVRALLALAAALAAVGVTYVVPPLRPFPLLLPFPAAVVVCWYFGMWPGALCAIAETAMSIPLLRQLQSDPTVPVREQLRIALFLLVTISFGWIVRRLSQQRAQLALQDLQQQLNAAHTQRQLAEERASVSEVLRDRDQLLQLALKANGMGLWVWDLANGTVQWSDQVYRIAGLEPGAIEPSIEGWVRLIHPEDCARVRAAVDRTCTACAVYHQQYRLLQPDGSVRWVESQGRCQCNTEGTAMRVVGVIADITSRKRSEEAILRAEKLAVAGRLAASIAHEINNPLEAVANLLYLIATSTETSTATELAQQALDELMRVSLITQQTLKFHRQTGTPKSIRLSDVVHTVFALFRGRLHASHIDAEVQADDETEISCMPGEVQQIFANLVSNAIDAMPQGGRLVVRLRPSCDWRDYSTRGMRTTILDTGHGMSKTTRERIFEPFFTTKTDTGTGLGMWVVAQLVERQGGSVSVWSTQRKEAAATAISLFLPLGIPDETTSSTQIAEFQHH